MKTLVLLLLLLGLPACSTLNENQCRKGDWFAYGKVDGTHGRTTSYLNEHHAACEGYDVTVDQDSYERGWKEGVAEYCTPASGYQAGLRGENYLGVCSGPRESAFKQTFEQGRRIHLLRRQVNETTQELTELNKTAKKDPSLGETVLDQIGLTPDGAKRNDLELRRRLASSEITQIEAGAPTEFPAHLDLRPTAVSAALGSYAGMVIGFGSGHAIQGRYLSKGWLFTISEAAAIGAMAALPSLCRGNSGCAGASVALPFLAFLGLKIWESADVFRHANAQWQGYPHLE